MLQKHPDHRGLRKGFVDSAPDPRIFRALQKFFPEAGPVVAEHLDNPFLNIRLACGGGIDGDVAAFGVSAHPDAAGELTSGKIQICGPLLLGRNWGQERHIEIFLPAHKGGIRPPIRGIDRSIPRQAGDGGKLLFFLEIEPVYIKGQPGLLKARALCQRGEKLSVALAIPHIPEQRVGRSAACDLFDRNRSPVDGIRDDPVKMKVGKLGKDQAVHRCESPA